MEIIALTGIASTDSIELNGNSGTQQIVATGTIATKGDTGATGATGEPGTNGQGVPTGGTTGQQLAKINGTDYNTQWVNPVDISGKADTTALTAHTSNTSNPHSVTKAQVGLGNVTNDTQVKASDVDTDASLAANSDTKVPSQKATKTYANTLTLPNLTDGMPMRRANADMATWLTKVRSATDIVDVVIIADSYAVVQGIQSYPWELEKILATQSGASTRPPTIGYRHATGGAPVPRFDSFPGTNDIYETLAGYGGTLTTGQKTTVTGQCDGVSVVYRKAPGAGDLIVRDGVGGTVLTTLVCNGTAALDVWTSSALTSASHVIELEASGGSVQVDGAYLHEYNRTKGVRVWNCGRAGAQTSTFIDNPAMGLDLINFFQNRGSLGAVLIGTGTNDAGTEGGATELTTFYNGLKAINSAIPIFIWIQFLNGSFPASEEAPRRAAAKALTDLTIAGIAITPDAPARFMSGDTVHPTVEGEKLIARQIGMVMSGDPIGRLTRQASTAEYDIAATNTALALKAPIASPTLTGTVTIPSTLSAKTATFVNGNFLIAEVFGYATIAMKETADSNPELEIFTKSFSAAVGGPTQPIIRFGIGTSPADTNLYRNGVAELKTDGKLTIGTAGTSAGSATTIDGTQTLTNKTLTSPVINTGVSGTAIDTDGTLAANSDTKLASQKATKTYVDAKIIDTYRWIAPSDMGAQSSFVENVNILGGTYAIYKIASTGNVRRIGLPNPPIGWNTMDVEIYWAVTAAGTGTIPMSLDYTPLVVGSGATSQQNTYTLNATNEPDILKKDTLVSGVTASPQLASYALRYAAGNTFTGSLYVLGVKYIRVT